MHFSKTNVLIGLNGLLVLFILVVLVTQITSSGGDSDSSSDPIPAVTPEVRELEVLSFETPPTEAFFLLGTNNLVILEGETSKLHFVDVDNMTISSSVTISYGDQSLLHPVNSIQNPRLSDSIYMSARNGRLVQVSLSNFTVQQELQLGGVPTKMALADNGAKLLVLNEFLDVIHVVDTETWTKIKDVKVADSPTSLVTEPQSDLLYVAHRSSGVISVVSLTNLSVVGSLGVDGNPGDLAIHGNDSLVVTLLDKAQIQVVNLRNNQKAKPVAVNEFPNSVVLDNSTTYVLSSASNHGIAVINENSTQVDSIIQTGSSFEDNFGQDNLLLSKPGNHLLFLSNEKRQLTRVSL